MKTTVIIPSRYGSSRFEGKPLAMIAGKLMIQRVYENSKKARNITDVAVATDDKRILSAVESFGGKVIITSEKNRSGTDRVAEAAEILGMKDNDIIVNIQGDQPLFDHRSIEELVEPLIKDKTIEMSTLGFKIIKKEEITNPKDVKVTFDNNGFALYFSRTTIPYNRDNSKDFDVYKHLGLYAYTKKFIDIFSKLPEGKLEKLEKLEQLRALEYGHKIKIVISRYDSPEVNLPEDITMIENCLKELK